MVERWLSGCSEKLVARGRCLESNDASLEIGQHGELGILHSLKSLKKSFTKLLTFYHQVVALVGETGVIATAIPLRHIICAPQLQHIQRILSSLYVVPFISSQFSSAFSLGTQMKTGLK